MQHSGGPSDKRKSIIIGIIGTSQHTKLLWVLYQHHSRGELKGKS